MSLNIPYQNVVTMTELAHLGRRHQLLDVPNTYQITNTERNFNWVYLPLYKNAPKVHTELNKISIFTQQIMHNCVENHRSKDITQ
mgnify:CR=1